MSEQRFRRIVSQSVAGIAESTGISAGASLEVRLKVLKISPALQFTHWGPQGYHIPSAEIIVNQVEFLTGFLL